MASNAENVSIWWRHHAWYVNPQRTRTLLSNKKRLRKKYRWQHIRITNIYILGNRKYLGPPLLFVNIIFELGKYSGIRTNKVYPYVLWRDENYSMKWGFDFQKEFDGFSWSLRSINKRQVNVCVNSLWPSDAIWWCRSGSKLPDDAKPLPAPVLT